MVEYTDLQTNMIQNLLDDKEVIFFESHEGTLIRLFYSETNGILPHDRKLNAFKSNGLQANHLEMALKKH